MILLCDLLQNKVQQNKIDQSPLSAFIVIKQVRLRWSKVNIDLYLSSHLNRKVFICQLLQQTTRLLCAEQKFNFGSRYSKKIATLNLNL